MLQPIDMPPGILKVGTGLQGEGRWVDGSLVRWREGSLRPIKGWQDFCTIPETPRGAITWSNNEAGVWHVAGTYAGLYSITEAGVVTDITPAGYVAGRETSIEAGYGTWFYGMGDYGESEGGDVIPLPATTWSLDTWGENLVACADTDGILYEWDTLTATAETILNAPTGCQGLMVTDERFFFALGADGNRRRVAWCDQENNTVWTPTATNQAGDIDLETAGNIMQGLRARGQALILTDVDAHTASYSGQPFIYSFERVGANCGTISAKAGASLPIGAVWMGRDQFYVYDGSGVQPLPCEVTDFVYKDMNRQLESLIFAVTNAANDEVWWFFAAGDATENNRYVSFNYRAGFWSTGYLARSTGVDRMAARYPIYFAPGGAGYQHEVGVSYGGETPFVESGPIKVDAGDSAFMVRRVVPDDGTTGGVQLTLKARRYPDALEHEQGPYDIRENVSFRVSGRQMRLRVAGVAGQAWQWGVPRLDMSIRGRR